MLHPTHPPCGTRAATLWPVGHLEFVFAERVALVLWRLWQVACYERDVVALQQERVEENLAESSRFCSRRPPDSRLIHKSCGKLSALHGRNSPL